LPGLDTCGCSSRDVENAARFDPVSPTLPQTICSRRWRLAVPVARVSVHLGAPESIWWIERLDVCQALLLIRKPPICGGFHGASRTRTGDLLGAIQSPYVAGNRMVEPFFAPPPGRPNTSPALCRLFTGRTTLSGLEHDIVPLGPRWPRPPAAVSPAGVRQGVGRAPQNTSRESVTICAASEPKFAFTLSHLKQIPVRILEPRGVTPGELEDLGRLELHSARLQRLERRPDIFDLDRINGGTRLAPSGCAWPKN
jgi:hypothetical protein